MLRSLACAALKRRLTLAVSAPQLQLPRSSSSGSGSSSHHLTAPATRFLSTVPSLGSPKKSFNTQPLETKGIGGNMLAALNDENPHVNVVRYEHKDRLWTMNRVQYWSEALAIGLLDYGLKAGDRVVSWLPERFSEQMVLQFACSKAGLILYELDPSLAIKDPEAAKVALRKALTITKANVLVSQEAGDDVNYVRLAHAVIPELEIQDMGNGIPFLTPRFPHLRICIQTGFDDEEKHGWFRYHHMLTPGSDDWDSYQEQLDETGTVITADMPLKGTLEVDAQGIPTAVGKSFSNKDVLEQNLWPTYCKILQKEFHEVEGVGVVF